MQPHHALAPKKFAMLVAIALATAIATAAPAVAQVTNDVCGDGLGTHWFGIMNDDITGPARADIDLQRVDCSDAWTITFTHADGFQNVADVVLERNGDDIALVLIGACVMRGQFGLNSMTGEVGTFTETIAGTHSCGSGQSFVVYAGHRMTE